MLVHIGSNTSGVTSFTGLGVSNQTRQGCPLHQKCRGAGAVVNYIHQGGTSTATAAHFRQGAQPYLCVACKVATVYAKLLGVVLLCLWLC